MKTNSLPKKRILIIEDEIDLAEIYAMFLEGNGYDVLKIYPDPLFLFAGNDLTVAPDIIIIDERLRGHVGSEYIPKLRETFPEAKLLLATADPHTVRLAITLGADMGMRKPFSLISLVANIETLLE